MKEIVNAFVNGWLKRQLLKWVAMLGVLIGANSSGTEAVVSFALSGLSFILEQVFSRMARKRAEKLAAAIPRALPADR